MNQATWPVLTEGQRKKVRQLLRHRARRRAAAGTKYARALFEERREEVRRCVRAGGSLEPGDVAARTGVPVGCVRDILRNLENRGEIEER